MATAWLQRYDYSSEELGDLSRTEMVAAFNSLDWPSELSQGNEDDPNANCPPGFGINQGANTLHLCPYDARNMFFHLHYEVDARFLGIIPIKRNKNHYVESHPLNNAHKVISHFVDNDLRPILEIK